MRLSYSEHALAGKGHKATPWSRFQQPSRAASSVRRSRFPGHRLGVDMPPPKSPACGRMNRSTSGSRKKQAPERWRLSSMRDHFQLRHRMGKVRGIACSDAFGPSAPGEGRMERITRETSSLVVAHHVHSFLDWCGWHLTGPRLEFPAPYDLARIGRHLQDDPPGRGRGPKLLPSRYARSATHIAGKHDAVRSVQLYGSGHAATMAHSWHS